MTKCARHRTSGSSLPLRENRTWPESSAPSACSHTHTDRLRVLQETSREIPFWRHLRGVRAGRTLGAKSASRRLLPLHRPPSRVFFDHDSAFATGIGERFEVADEGWRPAQPSSHRGARALAAAHRQVAGAEECEMSFFQDKEWTMGFRPLSCGTHAPTWPIPIVSTAGGVIQIAGPVGAPCYKLGQTCGRTEKESRRLSPHLWRTGGLCPHQCTGKGRVSTRRRGDGSFWG